MANRRFTSSRSRRRRTSQPFLEKGVTALVLGLLMWVPSLLSPDSPILRTLAQGVRTPALVAIVLGVALLGVHALLRGMTGSRAAKADADAPTAPVHPAGPAKGPALSPLELPGAPPTSWSPDVLAAIEWRRFEAVVETLFGQAGFDTRSQSHGPDGGVDIWLHSRNAVGPVAVVQCKHWHGKPVGVREVREFLGVMTSHGLKRGTYATSSTFTGDALAFAKANGINAQDGQGVLRMIQSRTPAQQAELLKVATEGEYWRPTCASCGIKLVPRQPRHNARPFWGCENYPACRSTLPMRQATT